MAHREVESLRPTPPPRWLRDCIIYELNPRTFTSPDGEGDGSGSGTFRSLAERLPYLKELGVTAIWLAGHTWGSTHFSGFWTGYAVRDPRVQDPALGGGEELKALIQAAHALGLRVLGEVVTHGVTLDSPLLQEHPHWFSGGEWGMADYDYTNPEFLDWWVRLWTDTTREYGFDGYRLDGPNGVATFEQVMGAWDRIARDCLEQGNEIAVMGENSRYHFRQGEIQQFSHRVARDFTPHPPYACMQISCHDEGINMGAGNYYVLRGSRFQFGYGAVFAPNIPLFMAGEEFDAGVHTLPAVKKEIYPGFEQCKEIRFYDKNPGGVQGGWLLGNRLDWGEIGREPHRSMLEDCRKILAIRNGNADILHYDRSRTNILPLDCSPKGGSEPYIRFLPGEKAIAVVGNEKPVDRRFILRIPTEEMGMSASCYCVTDLWDDSHRYVPGELMCCLEVDVPGDYQPGGGVRAIRIEPVGESR